MTYMIYLLFLLLCLTHSRQIEDNNQTTSVTPVNITLNDFILKDFQPKLTEVIYEQRHSELLYYNDVEDYERRDEHKTASIKADRERFMMYNKFKRVLAAESMSGEFNYTPYTKVLIDVVNKTELPTYDDKKYKEYYDILDKMTRIYGLARVCPFNYQECFPPRYGLDSSEIEMDIENSLNHEKRLYYWESWIKATGTILKPLYENMIEIKTSFDNFTEISKKYQKKFLKTVSHVWKAVQPYYNELHEYVRRKLMEEYPYIEFDGDLLPAHILGNLWSNSWHSCEKSIRPYYDPADSKLDGNLKHHFSEITMFRAVNEFYMSLGYSSLEKSYQMQHSRISRPANKRNMICQPSTYDLRDGYRVRMCAKVNFENLFQIYSLLGKMTFDANKEFDYLNLYDQVREIHGQALALSGISINSLQLLNLIPGYHGNYKTNINYLMRVALMKLAFIPVSIVVDLWRYEVYTKEIPASKWNSRWWELMEEYAKISPPSDRSDETDLDPAALFHIATDKPYPDFIANIQAFSFFKSMCTYAERDDPRNYTTCPLHKCNLYNGKNFTRKYMTDIKVRQNYDMEAVLMSDPDMEMSVDIEALTDYFSPLYKFLKNENAKMQTEKVLIPLLIVTSLAYFMVAGLFILFCLAGRTLHLRRTQFRLNFRRGRQFPFMI